MSTNDTVFLLANGAASPPGAKNVSDEELKIFEEAVTMLAQELAQLIVRDGEGATKFVTVHVKVSSWQQPWTLLRLSQGAATYGDAHTLASRISASALVKTAFYGEDAK